MPDAAPKELPIEAEQWKWLGGVFGLYAVERMNPAELQTGLAGVRRLEFPEGAPIIREGEASADFYIVFKGRAVVSRGGKRMAEIVPGDFFGEMGFLVQVPRTATVSAGKDCEVFHIQAKGFEQFVDKYPGLLESFRASAKRRMAKLQT